MRISLIIIFTLNFTFCFSQKIKSNESARIKSTFGVNLSGSITVNSILQTNNPRTRSFVYHLPTAVPDTARPLLIVLHGDGGTGAGIQSYTGFDAIADTANFLVVYPNSLLVNGALQWNKFADGTTGSGDNGMELNAPDDEKFIVDLIDYFYQTYKIKRSQVYVTGHSGGGFMSYFLSISNTSKNRIAAIAPVAASLWGDGSTGGYLQTQFGASAFSATPILHLHSPTDSVVQFPNLVNPWPWPLANFGFATCSTPTFTTQVISPDIDKLVFCGSPKPVILMKLKQSTLGHGWPSIANSGYNAPLEIWNFVKNYSKGIYIEPIPQPCLQNISITASNTFSPFKIVEAYENISTASPPNVILNNTNTNNLTLLAGKSVSLNPGFKADNGAVFKAQIGNCGSIVPVLRVLGTKIKDKCGNDLKIRGVNFTGYYQYDSNNPQLCFNRINQIKLSGSNTVRLPWGANTIYNRDYKVLDSLMKRIVSQKMIVMVDFHEKTCAQLTPANVAVATNYWLSPNVLAVLKKYEKYLILNIANEVGIDFVGNTAAVRNSFIAAYTPAILALRAAGIKCPLAIDAPDCGQNIEVLVDTAPTLLAADSERNIIFSAHAYWGNDNYAIRLNAAINTANTNNICLIIGEFSVAQDCPLTAVANDYNSIMSVCNTNSIGYLSWEWGGSQQYSGAGTLCPDDARGVGYSRLTMSGSSGLYADLLGWGLDVKNDIQATSVESCQFQP